MEIANAYELTKEQLAAITDYTFLKTEEEFGSLAMHEWEFTKFLINGLEYQPYAVCVRPDDVQKTAEYLKGKKIKIASVIGFPYPDDYTTEVKVHNTIITCVMGADEIDMVMDYNKLKSGDYEYVKEDIRQVVEAAHSYDAILKLILEVSELSHEQIKEASEIAWKAGVDFIKTSTGYTDSGATVEAVNAIREVYSGPIKVSDNITPENIGELLEAVYQSKSVYIDPNFVRIGSSSLLDKLFLKNDSIEGY